MTRHQRTFYDNHNLSDEVKNAAKGIAESEMLVASMGDFLVLQFSLFDGNLTTTSGLVGEDWNYLLFVK